MKFRQKIQVLLCSLFLLSCSQEHSSAVMTDTNGHITSSDSFKGKWVVLNYWADWCEACMEEVPELNQFYHDEKGKNVVLLGVNYDGLLDQDLQDAINKSGIQFPVVVGDFARMWDLSRVEYLPTTFIIDPSGKVVHKFVGASTEQAFWGIINPADADKSS